MTSAARGREALVALCRARLSATWPRLGLALAALLVALQAAGALVLRAADGPRFFAEGIVAKALGIHLLLVAVPLSLRAAAGPARLRVEPALVAMARQRGLQAHLGQALLRASISVTLRRTLTAPLVLALALAPLTLPDAHALGRRLAVLAGVLSAGALAAAALTSAAFLLGKLAPRAPRGALVVALALSAALALSDTTRPASPIGAYLSLVDAIVAHAPE